MAEEKYLKQYEKSASGNYLLKSRGTLLNILTTTAARTFTQEESGSAVFIDGAVTHELTLPAHKDGVNFKFVCEDGTAIVNVNSVDGNDFIGLIIDGAGTGDEAAGTDDKVIFTAAAVAGDAVELTSKGSKWYVTGGCDAANGVKFG
jgi:hypothetical protein